MKPLELELLGRFKTLLSERLKGFQLIAFGSRARGDGDEDSDLDVLVLIDEPRTPELREFVSGCAWEAGLGSGIVLATVMMTREEWTSDPQPDSLLALAVQEEGISV
jgi:uncharacterized protein